MNSVLTEPVEFQIIPLVFVTFFLRNRPHLATQGRQYGEGFPCRADSCTTNPGAYSDLRDYQSLYHLGAREWYLGAASAHHMSGANWVQKNRKYTTKIQKNSKHTPKNST
jgi:hypothetical protein